MMKPAAFKTELKEIQSLHNLFLKENNFQIRYNACISSVIFRQKSENYAIFEHKVEPVGEYVLELHGEVVATGGFMLHYNMPLADLYMEVHENFRGKSLGSFLLQELKKSAMAKAEFPQFGVVFKIRLQELH